MNKIINIRSRSSIAEIQKFKDKRYSLVDVKFENIHLKDINRFVLFNLFDKNDLYINSTTLWELMQPIGDSGSHNYHDLTPEDIYNALNTINNPYCVLKVKHERYAVIPVYVSSFDEPLMIVIEKGAELINKQNANINKIVTIYPKSDFDKYLQNLSEDNVLYIKK